jgi:uncharacterized DUF497 family protein
VSRCSYVLGKGTLIRATPQNKSYILPIEFAWDPNKAEINLRWHGVSFHEAATVLGDPLSTTVPDPDHSLEEDRYIIVGTSNHGRVLMVAHTEQGDHIRIISARELTRRERRQYEEGST